MKTYSSQDVIKKLKQEGWQEVKGGKGSHKKLRHPIRGTTIVPKGDLLPKTYLSIARKAGWLQTREELRKR